MVFSETMVASDRDKAYFERIGAIKDALHQETTQRHRSLPLSERLTRSWALYLTHRSQKGLAQRDDDPSPFYDRARRLGLYKG